LRENAPAANLMLLLFQKISDSPFAPAELADLQPPRVKTFKLSRDPRFPEKPTDGVGLYLKPPDLALMPCVVEET
jgi:hypothetical protein